MEPFIGPEMPPAPDQVAPPPVLPELVVPPALPPPIPQQAPVAPPAAHAEADPARSRGSRNRSYRYTDNPLSIGTATDDNISITRLS